MTCQKEATSFPPTISFIYGSGPTIARLMTGLNCRGSRLIQVKAFYKHFTKFDVSFLIKTVCGGDLNVTTHGTISSPGSPGNYPINRDCEWFITAPPGKRIQFLFFTLMIEAHQTCAYDYVEVHSGLGTETPSLGKYCNTTNPPPLLTPSHTATIHFHSDGDSNDAGFQIAYSVVEGFPGCGGTYTSAKGDIVSPTNIEDGKYKHNIICDYVIQLPKESRIRIEFKKFALEDSSSCKFDRVEVMFV